MSGRVAWFKCEKCNRSEMDSRSTYCRNGCLYTIPVYWHKDKKIAVVDEANSQGVKEFMGNTAANFNHSRSVEAGHLGILPNGI